MHDTAMLNGKRFFDTYIAPLGPVTVVDIGSQDVNGSLREVCPPQARYVGVDFIQARGVDVVLDDPYKLPFETGSVDAVVSSSCFEHSEMFWLLYLEILRVLKPAGLFYLNAPSNGPFHRYPVDCWRFYPDSANALVRWGGVNGLDSLVLEAYTSQQIDDVWSDYVAVLVKDKSQADRYPKRILNQIQDFTNGQSHPAVTADGPLLNFESHPEDARRRSLRYVPHNLMRSLRHRLRRLL